MYVYNHIYWIIFLKYLEIRTQCRSDQPAGGASGRLFYQYVTKDSGSALCRLVSKQQQHKDCQYFTRPEGK